MSVVDFVCLALGSLTGLFLAARPKMDDPNPSIFRLAALGTAAATLMLFLAVAAGLPHFAQTTVATLVLCAISFFVMKPVFERGEQRDAQPKSKPIEGKIETTIEATATHKAA